MPSPSDQTYKIDSGIILETVSDGILVVDQAGLVLHANPAAHTILERDELVGRNLGLPFGLNNQVLETQIIRKSGLGWAAIRCNRTELHGKPAYVLAISDISALKNTQQELMLAAEVYSSTNDGIIITDARNNIISVNAAFTRITGYTAEDVQGKNPRVISSGRQPPEFYKEMWQVLLLQDYWAGEIFNRRKNGEVFPEWLSISVVRDNAGHIHRHIGILSDLTQQKMAQDKIEQLANYDHLTWLPNQGLLRDRVRVVIGTAQRLNQHVTVMFLDLDRFKNINESLGHEVGDLLLQQVAERLQSQLREEDTISRLGGDEFILVLSDTNAIQAAYVAEKLLRAMLRPYHVDQSALTLTASIGIAIYPENGVEFAVLSRAADTALFRAKQGGRNKFEFFTESMLTKAHEDLRLENELRKALPNSEFLVYYQPQVDAKNSQLLGLEALIRWQHPERGLVSPAEFIPLAEETGLIVDIGRWVLQETIRQNKAWKQEGLTIVPIAVNLSLEQFRAPELCEDIALMLKTSDIESHYLELELTESIAGEDFSYVFDKIDMLIEMGVQLSIDDFGTGYSSLSRLTRFKVQRLKIDQSFIHSMLKNRESEAIVKAIIELARAMNFHSIAEGVETREQLDLLRKQGCDEIQGYYFSKPMPAEWIGALLRGDEHLAP